MNSGKNPDDWHRDPMIRKLRELKAEAEKLKVPDSILSGLQNLEDLYFTRENYCDSKTSKPSEAMSALMKGTWEHPWDDLFKEGKTLWDITPRMLCGNVEASVLKFLISISKGKRALEVGMFTGCSALAMAEVMPEDGKVTTCEFDPYLVELARKFIDRSPHGKKVEILSGDAKDSLNGLVRKGEKFDFVFIDADKTGYCDYFNICLNDLLAPGGTIVMDNALDDGKPYLPDTPKDQGVLRFNKMIVERDDIYHVLIPVRDGVMLIRRKEDMHKY